MAARNRQWGSALRLLALLVLALFALQLFFLARIASWRFVDPQSTSFQRSQAYQIALSGTGGWTQEWVPTALISMHIKRAVIASEDDEFANHNGVQWDAIQSAWEKNAKAQQRAEQRAQAREKTTGNAKESKSSGNAKPPKIVGGSTITQQLAKNLLLSGERNLVRKAQELVLTLSLELFLDKPRILEIYLNNVEWGEGVYGIEAAAHHYFRTTAAKLNAYESARLAVMLPRPKFFEKQSGSAYLAGRANVIVGRMAGAQVP